MKITIRAINIELTPAIEAFAEEKIRALTKFLKDSDLLEARIELGMPSRHHKSGPVFYAEVNLNIAGKLLRAIAEDYDLYIAIDKVRDELEVQIKKFKDKKTSAQRKHHK